MRSPSSTWSSTSTFEPPPQDVRELLAKAERDCFVGASLTDDAPLFLDRRRRGGSVSTTLLDVEAVRRRYSALQRNFVFFDGPGGTQCPDEVIDAIADYLREDNANIGAPYETSLRTVALIERARAAAGRFLNCHPDEVAFGPSMTSLNFLLTRALGTDAARGGRDRLHEPGSRRERGAVAGAGSTISESSSGWRA